MESTTDQTAKKRERAAAESEKESSATSAAAAAAVVESAVSQQSSVVAAAAAEGGADDTNREQKESSEKESTAVAAADPVTVEELIANSKAFKHDFPTRANRIEYLLYRDGGLRGEIERHANGVRPVLLESVRQLLGRFLDVKRASGSAEEKALYSGEVQSVEQLVTRLLRKRPLVFLNRGDMYIDRLTGLGGSGGFGRIGTGRESNKSLQDYISYDEMMLSALIGMSVPTFFINDGSRGNCAREANPGTYERFGIHLGLVGARFEREFQMESALCLIDKSRNASHPYAPVGRDVDLTTHRGQMMKMWADFYGVDHFPDDAEVRENRDDPRFVKLRYGPYFNQDIYKRRMLITVKTLLLEAEARAKEYGKKAFIHQVGLGLGMWMKTKAQGKWLVDVHAHAIKSLHLKHVSDLRLAWFPSDCYSCGGAQHGDTLESAAGVPIRILFTKDNPCRPLTGKNAGKLLIAVYAWDSNSFPGNEYWGGQLAASGDPAAACSSTIPQLQNPYVNPKRVNGAVMQVLSDPAGGDAGGDDNKQNDNNSNKDESTAGTTADASASNAE